eukprot:gene10826-3444_t
MQSRIETTSSESILKSEIDNLSDENKRLKSKIDLLLKENSDMKSTIYELNMKFNQNINEDTNEYFDIISKPTNGLEEEKKRYTNNNHETIPSKKQVSSSEEKKEIFRKHFVLTGHEGSVYSCKFSSNGQFLSSCSFDKTLRIWNIDHQEEVLNLNEHEFGILDLDWSLDDEYIVSGGIDKCIKIWNLKKEKCLNSILTNGFIQCLKFDCNDIIYSGDSKNELNGFDFKSNNNIFNIKNDSIINTIHVHKSGKFILIGDHNGNLKTFDLRNLKLIDEYKISNYPISSISISKNLEEGRYLSVSSYDNIIRMYDRGSLIHTGKPKYQLKYSWKDNFIQNWPIKSSFNQNLLATGSTDNVVKIYDTSKGKLIQTLKSHTDIVFGVDFHPLNQSLLASCSGDSTIMIYSKNEN